MPDFDAARVRARLGARKHELNELLERIRANLGRRLDADAKERAKELEDRDVVDTLGNDATDELRRIAATLERLDSGRYGICEACGSAIGGARLEAYPCASLCIDCAEDVERLRKRA